MGLPCNGQACLLMSKVVNSFKQGMLCTLVAQLGGGGVGGWPVFNFTYCFGLHSKAAIQVELTGRETTYWPIVC